MNTLILVFTLMKKDFSTWGLAAENFCSFWSLTHSVTKKNNNYSSGRCNVQHNVADSTHSSVPLLLDDPHQNPAFLPQKNQFTTNIT